jgi:Uma2 family endonuclease
MDAEAFLAWSERQPKEAGRFELWDGVVVNTAEWNDELKMYAGDSFGHADLKFDVVQLLKGSIKRRGKPCQAYVDGPQVRIATGRVYQPDAIVRCGPPPPSDQGVATDPLIVVEVVSASSIARDYGDKLIGYFSVPSIMHYLIVDPFERRVMHHRRTVGQSHEASSHPSGILTLDPPGIDLDISALFPSVEDQAGAQA